MKEFYICPRCRGKEFPEERLKNGVSKKGHIHRRQRFVCEDCGHHELIHAAGARDVKQYEKQDELSREKEKETRNYLNED
jgi:predicted nucleic-acid-binding Zn-ribbon protein